MAKRELVTRQQLDEHVDGPGEMLELRPGCHNSGGVAVAYGDGALELSCHKCGKPMFIIGVAGAAPDGA